MSTVDRRRRIGPVGSRLLHAIDGFASRPLLAVVVVIADVVWVVYSMLVGFPTRLEAISKPWWRR